jgi:hypothetical protein
LSEFEVYGSSFESSITTNGNIPLPGIERR